MRCLGRRDVVFRLDWVGAVQRDLQLGRGVAPGDEALARRIVIAGWTLPALHRHAIRARHQAAPEEDLLIPPDGVVKRKSTDLVAVHDPHVATTVRFIQDHLSEPFGVEQLLRLLPISRRRLENLFRKCLGRTPYDYLCHVRVNRAKELLAASEKLSMGEISDRCGFPNSQRFRLVFTRLVGKTPTAYRRDLSAQRFRPVGQVS